MKQFKENLRYYVWASYRRKKLDTLLVNTIPYYRGVVLDIGGKDRGNFRKPKKKVEKWIFADIEANHHPDLVLDVMDMSSIGSKSVDVVMAYPMC